jgi:hypothetical protein|nr:MAG TPA: hypothetical protein [Caudoviricetes sp.]
MQKYNFIRTSDKEIKEKLLSEGFELVSQDGDVVTFLNNHSLTFDNTNQKIQYTNMLTF